MEFGTETQLNEKKDQGTTVTNAFVHALESGSKEKEILFKIREQKYFLSRTMLGLGPKQFLVQKNW